MNLVYNKTESISFLGPKIWNILPYRLTKIDSLGTGFYMFLEGTAVGQGKFTYKFSMTVCST